MIESPCSYLLHHLSLSLRCCLSDRRPAGQATAGQRRHVPSASQDEPTRSLAQQTHTQPTRTHTHAHTHTPHHTHALVRTSCSLCPNRARPAHGPRQLTTTAAASSPRSAALVCSASRPLGASKGITAVQCSGVSSVHAVSRLHDPAAGRATTAALCTQSADRDGQRGERLWLREAADGRPLTAGLTVWRLAMDHCSWMMLAMCVRVCACGRSE